jgi:aerobic-type carbon monoxide dehydrogenase small subunit (CoxS/CutS family)
MPAEYVTLTYRINGEERTVAHPAHHTLLEVLREVLDLPGTKHGCELGECGTCTVLVDGEPELSCLLLAQEVGESELETVEGLEVPGGLHPLQRTFADLGAAQCGYCTPGILMAAKSLIARNPDPHRDEIREALAGNLCRCTGYIKILEAVEWAAALCRGESDATPREESLFGTTSGEDHHG